MELHCLPSSSVYTFRGAVDWRKSGEWIVRIRRDLRSAHHGLNHPTIYILSRHDSWRIHGWEGDICRFVPPIRGPSAWNDESFQMEPWGQMPDPSERRNEKCHFVKKFGRIIIEWLNDLKFLIISNWYWAIFEFEFDNFLIILAIQEIMEYPLNSISREECVERMILKLFIIT